MADANTLGDTAGPSGGGFFSGLMDKAGGIGGIVGLGTSLFRLDVAAKKQKRRDKLREELFDQKMRGLDLGGLSDKIASRRAMYGSGAQSMSGFGGLQRKGEGFLSSL